MRRKQDNRHDYSVTGSIFCKCVVKSGFYSNDKKRRGASLQVGNYCPLHWSLEEPAVAGLSHQKHRGGTHYYAAFTPCLQSSVFSSLMISRVQSATKKKQAFAAKTSSFARGIQPVGSSWVGCKHHFLPESQLCQFAQKKGINETKFLLSVPSYPWLKRGKEANKRKDVTSLASGNAFYFPLIFMWVTFIGNKCRHPFNEIMRTE